MPMIVPHQSQVGISTANGGQTAPYRSASAFMTPGQAAAPEGLKQLARGMDKLGGAVNALLLERQNMRNAADLLADKIAYEDALRDFDSNYRQTHQGVSARDAEEAYGQFHKEQYDKLQKKWGGNPWLMQGVNRMAEGIRLPSMQRAVNYRDQQEQFYQKSVLDSSEAHALELFADPSCSMAEKEAALQDHERSLRMFAGQRPVMVDGKIQWQGGRNIDAELMALRRKAALADIEGRIAIDDIDGAERAFGQAGGYGGVLNGRTYTGGGTVRGLPADIDAKIEAEAKRQGFDPVLAKAIAMQESGGRQGEVSKAGAVGVMQIIPKYAGDFGGGDVRGNVDDNIRVGIKEISTYLKRYGGDLRKALLAYNWGPGNVDAWLKTGRGVKGQPMPQEAREYADRVLGRISGGSFTQAPKGQKAPEAAGMGMPASSSGASPKPMPGGSILAPSDRLRIRHQLDAARELQRKEQADATAQHIVSVTASFPPAQQEAEAYRLMEALPPDVRAKVKSLVDGGLKFRKDAMDAQYGANMAEALELFPKMAPAEREQSIDAMERGKKISPEMADKLRTWNNKEASKITPERQKTFDNLLASMNRRIALGVKDALTDTSEIDREFARGNLTQKQREELVKIQRNSGALKNFDKPHLDSLYQKIIGKKDVEMPGEMYSRLFRMAMDAGKPLDDDAIQTLIARELTPVTTPGRFWGTNEIPLWEAESSEAGSNKAKVIGIPVPKHLEQYVTDEMRARGFTEAQMNDQKTREQFYANTFYGRK